MILAVVLIFMGCAFAVAAGFYIARGDDLSLPLAFMAVASLFVGVVLLAVDRYKDGQVDALNGIVKYRIATYKDKTSEWVRIDGK